MAEFSSLQQLCEMDAQSKTLAQSFRPRSLESGWLTMSDNNSNQSMHLSLSSRNRWNRLSILMRSANRWKLIMTTVCGRPQSVLFRRWSPMTQHTTIDPCVRWFFPFFCFAFEVLRLLSLPSHVANSNSAYDIVSYANNVKSTLKRTISCDSDNESTLPSLTDSCQSRENIGLGKLQITINYNAYVNQLKETHEESNEMFLSIV